MHYIKTRLISNSGKFYGITDFKRAVEFRFTSDGDLFAYYNSHAACKDKRKKKDINETCVQIGSRCHCVRKQVPPEHYNALVRGYAKDENAIYSALEAIFNN